MIIYFSPNDSNGGVLQFATTIAVETQTLIEYRLFLADTVEKSLYQHISDNVIVYDKPKTLNTDDGRIIDISEQIAKYSPDGVIFVEDTILSQQIIKHLNKKGIHTAMVVHDILHHPYRKMGLRRILIDYLRRRMTRNTIKRCDKIILLSENSRQGFISEYKCKNTLVFKLSAHVPDVPAMKPPELEFFNDKYLLFFGRIDEYKGIELLSMAYSRLPAEYRSRYKLIIAGNGLLSSNEQMLIENDKCIHLIKRFISDGEMIWLFENCRAVVLPYIEASQSGVLPIAYKYGKPVVVSNLQGLTENVIENITGFIYRHNNEMTQMLIEAMDRAENMTSEIECHYSENYDWKTNIVKMLNELNWHSA